MRKILAIALLFCAPSWGQFGMNVPLRTNAGLGINCPAAATGPQPPSLRGSTINEALFSVCITTAYPPGSQVGDFAVLFFSAGDPTGLVAPSGWTSIYLTPVDTSDWNTLAAYTTLTILDIAAFRVTACNTNEVPFDEHLGVVVFAGGTGSVREVEGTFGGFEEPLTNITSSSVLSSDVGLYFSSERHDGGPFPLDSITITPNSGVAANLHGAITTNACSLMAAQQMPGGITSVTTTFAGGGANGETAVQVIVENP